MAVGLNVTKQDVDIVAGSIAKDLNITFGRITSFKAWLDSKTDAELITLGYVQADVDALRSAYGDANQLATIFNGTATLGVAKDFRTFLKRVWGLGS